MEIKAKLNRGPASGKRMVVPGTTVVVAKPVPFTEIYRRGPFGSDLVPEVIRGTYEKSNRQLKDGTWIYEWMGWIQ